IDFLRDVGKHFTVNQMVAKESVRSRLERADAGISYTEFSYMLLQAMDFLHLFDTFGCRLQLGASDQWGNITMGVELVRKVRGETVYGFTTPLVLKPDGTKFGKSETGTVWLDPAKTSPYELYQFLVRSDDSVVGAYLRYFTWLSRERIEELDAATATRPEQREAQRVLAWEVTKLVHDQDAAENAKLQSDGLFSDRLTQLQWDRVDHTPVPLGPISIVDALVATGLATSKSDARRQITGGGVYVEDDRVTDVELVLSPPLPDGGHVVVRRGKANKRVLRFVEGLHE
ncbi:MAG TPA: tyrosine--tRNA ligase, partial [Acidimicrobiales bacterium]